MNLEAIRDMLYNSMLNTKNMERLVSLDSFETAWLDSTMDERSSVVELIKNQNISKIKQWIQKHNLDNCTIRDLRARAQVLGVRSYSRLSKSELLSEIEEINGRASNKNIGTSGLHEKDSGEMRLQSSGHNLQEGQAFGIIGANSQEPVEVVGGDGCDLSPEMAKDSESSNGGALGGI